MRDSTALPDLRILETNTLIAHEEHEPDRVARLARRLLEEGKLKNPPVVAQIPNAEEYVVLDGANRTMAFQLAGIPHIVAQCVDYHDPNVIVDTWYHVVAGLRAEEFERSIQELTGMTLMESTLEDARRALKMEQAVAYIVCKHGVHQVLHAQGEPLSRMEILRRLVAVYRGKAEVYRASNDIWEIQEPYYPGIAALVIFPPLKPEDILHAAVNRYKIPAGITRHIIPARALNINIPIGILMSGWDIERKRQWLHDWLMERMATNAIRFYAESTFSFNE